MADRTISVYITGDASSLEQAAASAKAAIDALTSTNASVGIKPSPETEKFIQQLDEIKAKMEGLQNAQVGVSGAAEDVTKETGKATKAVTEAAKASGKGQHAFGGFSRGILSSTLHIGGLITPARLAGTMIGTILVAAIGQGIAAAEQFDAVLEKLATGTMDANAVFESFKAANQKTWVNAEQVEAAYGQMVRMQNITWSTADAYATLTAKVATFADEAKIDAGAYTRGIVDMQQAFNIDPKSGMSKWFEFFAYSAKFNEVGSNISLMIEGNTKSAQLAFEQLGYSAERYLLILGGMAHQGANITKLTNVMKLFTANMPAGTTETVMKNKWANLVNTLTSDIGWTLKQQALDAAGIAGRSQKEIEELSTWLQMSGPYYKRNATGGIATDWETGKPIVAASVTDTEAIKSLPAPKADTFIEASQLMWKGVVAWLGETAQSVYDYFTGNVPEEQNAIFQTIKSTLQTLEAVGVDRGIEAVPETLVEMWKETLKARHIKGPDEEQLKNVTYQQILKDLMKFYTGKTWKSAVPNPAPTASSMADSRDSGIDVAGYKLPTEKEFNEAIAFMEKNSKNNPSFNTMGVLKGYFQKIYDYWFNLFLTEEWRGMGPATLNQTNAIKELNLMKGSFAPASPQSTLPYDAPWTIKRPDSFRFAEAGKGYASLDIKSLGMEDVGKLYASASADWVSDAGLSYEKIVSASDKAEQGQAQAARMTLAEYRYANERMVRSAKSSYAQILWASRDTWSGVGNSAEEADGKVSRTIWNMHTMFGNIPIDVSLIQEALKEFGVSVPQVFDNLWAGFNRISKDMFNEIGLTEKATKLKEWLDKTKTILQDYGMNISLYWQMLLQKTSYTMEEISETGLDKVKQLAGMAITSLSEMFATGKWKLADLWKKIWTSLLDIAIQAVIKIITTQSLMMAAITAIETGLAILTGNYGKLATIGIVTAGIIGTIAGLTALVYGVGKVAEWADEKLTPAPDEGLPQVASYQPGTVGVSSLSPYPSVGGNSSIIQVNMAGANIYGTIDDASARKIGEGLTRSLAFRGIAPLAYS